MNISRLLSWLSGEQTVIDKLNAKCLELEARLAAVEEMSTDYHRNRRNAIFNIADYLVNAEIEGDYAEFGVFEGKTFAYANKLMGPLFPDMRFWAFDSFEGLPEPRGVDCENDFSSGFFKGQFACSREQFLKNLQSWKADISKVVTVPGWFDKSLSPDGAKKLDIGKICCAWIDVDLYDSTVPILKFIKDRLPVGAVVVFDDWHCYRNLPRFGEQLACKEWLQDNPTVVLNDFISFGFHGKAFTVGEHHSHVETVQTNGR